MFFIWADGRDVGSFVLRATPLSGPHGWVRGAQCAWGGGVALTCCFFYVRDISRGGRNPWIFVSRFTVQAILAKHAHKDRRNHWLASGNVTMIGSVCDRLCARFTPQEEVHRFGCGSYRLHISILHVVCMLDIQQCLVCIQVSACWEYYW